MAAKCNILGFVLQKLEETQWGIRSCDEVDKPILEDYIGYLECPEVTPPNCYPASPCINETIEVVCDTNINKLTVSVDGAIMIYTVLPTDMVGFTEPLSYEWTFDTAVFVASGPVNDYQLRLSVKPGLDITTLVAPVSVKITDKYGCTSTKQCFFTPAGLQCNINYVPCVNTHNLTIVNTLIQCVGPSGLIITKI